MQTKEWYREHIAELKFGGYTNEEQETVIVIPRNGTIRVSTYDNTMLTKFKRILQSPNTGWRLAAVSASQSEKDPYTVTELVFETDDPLVSIRAAKVNQNLTEEQRAAACERLRKGREVQNQNSSVEYW